ncbi:MAG: hypothetical protein COW18_12290 [Zetaproteobacteria bacterium CG12_big_fil_rev_8_21_14_0_65_54_13]|nr:MAG: hypothetical protein COX55_11070 [Zetaproteobacteria bacterium CG23_combo_of_CG06-09_8_20_14_all_54_7]PIW44891.1 MAG: hypothetical protein COW18_12290 [Zetaproteobacteria bacterium CG12_big_fil_rev_8_21_14_0_65_54_13]PJA28245.1 MAG: hypothetical protein CO188_10160 [Zetaproteobacteria bacterium CG_4_9_14_3_um_filter_54_145]
MSKVCSSLWTSFIPVTSATFLLLLLTPFAYPGFFPHDVNLLLACTASMLLCLALLVEQKRPIPLPKTLLVISLLLIATQLWLYSSGQLISTTNWQLQAILYATAVLLFVFGGSVSTCELKRLLQLYLLAAALWSLVGLFVWLGGTHGQPLLMGPVTLALAPALKLAGPFNQGNIFAGLIGFALLFSHWLAWKEKHTGYFIATAFFTAMLFDTLSRGEWLAYLLCVGCLLFALKPNTREMMRCFILPWLLGLMTGALILQLSEPALAEPNGIAMLASTAGATMEARLIIWATAISIFMQAPLTGSGWGQYAPQSWLAAPAASKLLNHFGLSHYLASNYLSAHNLFLHLMAEGGLIVLLPLLWGIGRLLQVTFRLFKQPHSIRLCFALAALSFILQSQVNITFTRPLPLLLTALFAGIAMAPALRRNCWRVSARGPAIGAMAITIATFLIWASPTVMQWFTAERALYNFDINNAESAKRLASFANIPRVGALPSIWIAYNVATTGSHRGLLQWVTPPLRAATHDLPIATSYQILFYTLTSSGKLQEACSVGRLIEAQHFPWEHNEQAYQDACSGKAPDRYYFGNGSS